MPRRFTTSTGAPLGTSRAWRWAVCVVAMGIITSATIAQQHIAANSAALPAIEQDTPAVVATTGTSVAPAVVEPAQTSAAQQFSAPSPGVVARPRDVATLWLPGSGVVEVVLVHVGDRVQPGEALLTFNDEEGRRAIAQLRVEAALAKNHAVELERAVKTIDDSIGALTADVPATRPTTESVPNEAKQATERAQAAYNEAIAREQRAAALEAHGVSATQELEAAQVEVRNAAAALALARREADAAATMASAQALQARTQAESAIVEQQRQRRERADELLQARLRQREAETALADATARYKVLTLRAPAAGVVAEVAVQPGDRTLAGTPLVKLAAVEFK